MIHQQLALTSCQEFCVEVEVQVSVRAGILSHVHLLCTCSCKHGFLRTPLHSACCLILHLLASGVAEIILTPINVS